MSSRDDERGRVRAARVAAEAAERRSAKRRTALLRLGLVLALAAVVVIIAVVLSSGGGDEPVAGGGGGTAANAEVADLYRGIPQNGVTLGDPKTDVTLIEFADLQCPFCAEYARQAMPTVVRDYVKPGKVKYELRIRSFLGEDSVRAAGAAAAAAKDDHLFQFADLFYRAQGEENSGYVTDAFLTGIAKAAGTDPAAVVAGAKDPSGQPLVAEAEQKAAELGSESTPDFYLRLAGGRLVAVTPADLTAKAFTAALDRALAQT